MGSEEEVKKAEPEVDGDAGLVVVGGDSKGAEADEQDAGKDKDKDKDKDQGCPKSEEKLAVVTSPPSDAGLIGRDAVLARVEMEKRYALIKAWEESEKTKAENRAYKKISSVGAWENTKRAAVEAQLKKFEGELEKKKAEYGEVMKNKVAEIHKVAEEKRAMVEARRGQDFVKIEEASSKFRASGHIPRKYFGCFFG